MFSTHDSRRLPLRKRSSMGRSNKSPYVNGAIRSSVNHRIGSLQQNPVMRQKSDVIRYTCVTEI